MNLLIIGGTGFFGKAILTFLLNNKSDIQTITIVGRSAKSFKKIYPHYCDIENIHFYSIDILKNLNDLGSEYTHIIHAAADSSNVSQLTYLDRYNQIVNGTIAVLEYIKNNCPEAKLLFVSSGGVYGQMPQNINSFKEDHPLTHNLLDPTKVYSIAKIAAENLCAIYHEMYGLKLSIVRCFSFSGFHLPLDVHFAIGNFVKNAISSEDITIQGNGLSDRSYLDQNDLAEWILTICKKDSFNCTLYNIGSDRKINIASLANMVSKISNKDIKVKILNQNRKELKQSRYVPDISKIKDTFGLGIKVPLEESIKNMIKHNQK